MEVKEMWTSVNISEKREYFVSNFGRFKSVSSLRKIEKILPFNIGKCGYHRVSMKINGKQKLTLIHRLVALKFIENTENKPQINHKDGDKSNNYASNLEWTTCKENVDHAFKTGLRVAPKGDIHYRYNKDGKPLYDKTTGELKYKSLYQASRILKMSPTTLLWHLNKQTNKFNLVR